MRDFLQVRKTEIMGPSSDPVILKGVNAGGWLMMEGYILHSLNLPEQDFKKKFARALGKRALFSFEKDFREHFIREDDIKAIARHGFNCVRVPFNCRLIETKPYHYSPRGLFYLEQIVQWARRYNIWVILDLHAAPGAQNHDWHSDSDGRALLWQKKKFQDRTVKLWEFLADHFSNEEAIAGYDLLNEAVLDDTSLLNKFYKRLIKAIRRVDRNHIIFVEGSRWAQDLECLEEFDDDNLVLSVHAYQPLDFTFNLVPQLSYPLRGRVGNWDRAALLKSLEGHKKTSLKRTRPVWVGEFGVHARQGVYGEQQWLKDILICFKDLGFHWTYWTYKAVKNHVFPDGIFSYFPNPPWVNRQGPLLGWETYHLHWPTRRKAMVRSWETGSFLENTLILDELKNAL